MYRTILVPTDGSVGTAHVALQAINLAETCGGTVHVLHVVDADLHATLGDLAGVDDDLESRGRRAVERVERMARAHGVDVVTAVEEGDPAAGILAHADEASADLIVVGTHGRSGIERHLLGSVTERVVRRAPCPVLTVGLPGTDVTVDAPDRASDIAEDALDAEGVDATVSGVDRQVNVWIADAEGGAGSFLVYVDPVTQRTSVIRRG